MSNKAIPERDDSVRKQFVLRAIRKRLTQDPKFTRDNLEECNFGSLDLYSGVVADLALEELGAAEAALSEAQQDIARLRKCVSEMDAQEQESDVQVAQLQATISQLTKALKNARQLGSIGYRIGEADMRGHDKIGERYAKQQAAIESEIDTALVHAQEKP